MKHFIKKTKLLLILGVLFLSFNLSAQTDMTSLLTNPSFETGNLTGWTWIGTTGYSWLVPNTDGDATKSGSYICGIWNAGIGDAECSQSISGLASGYYKVSALATVSNNRLTNQRLFANSVSQLYGPSSNTNYSTANLAILTSLGETYSFAGWSTSSAENGPFKQMSVVTHVTDGTLKIGFKVSGRSNTKGFVFTSVSSKSDEGFFKFDNFTLTDVSKVAVLDGISLNYGSLDTVFVAGKTNYTAILPAGITSVKPIPIVYAEGQTVTGLDAVDVSSGTGTSTIVVTSPDGTTSKTYTITYKVLSQTYKKVPDGVELIIPGGAMKIKVCTDKIFEVSYTNTATLPAKDTIIVNKVWNTPAFTVTDAGDSITITTQSMMARVSKTTYLVKYFDLAGNLLLSESKKSMTPTTVLTTATNTCVTTFNSPTTEGLYGLGQHQQKVMNYKGNSVVLDQQNKEIALPFLLSTNGYGLLWDNYSYTNFNGNLASNTQYQFSSESGKMIDYYFMYGPEPDSIINQYRIASGKAPMFPKWAYGLFQSKDKYSSSAEILTMANKYREAGFPLDCIVQDWDYWTPDNWGSHTMNSTRYPDPKALVDSLHAINVHTMISIWPVFHNATTNYQAFNAINAIYPSNGNHHFYDPHNDAAKKIYWNQVNTQLFGKYGWDAWWADNDEPQGYPDGFDRKNFITAKGSGVTYYNTYPIQHTAAVYEGWRVDNPSKRLFTLSRSAFSGQQRYATAAWSGDIQSNWTDFQLQLSAGLNFCMSGMPYWTTDIGGYLYVDWSTANNNELMTRWFQYGAFCPIFRIHGQGDKALVSSTLTQNTVDNLAKTDKLRYRLMPYIYSQAWRVTNENYTVMRHLVMDYRNDANVRSIDDQFMFGPSLLINPITSAGTTKRSVYLPAGKWFDFWTGDQYTGGQTITADAPLDKMPILVKAGAILPMGPDITYATQSVDPTEIRVYKGADGKFELYEDEGDNYNYEKGQYSVIPFTYDNAAGQLTIGDRKGTFNNMLTNRVFKVVIVDSYYGTGITSPVSFDSIVNYNGSQAIVTFKTNRTIPQSHYEAELATLSGSAQVSNTQTGFSGTGYVSGMNLSSTSKVTFNVSVPKTGIYRLHLRYSAGSGSARRDLSLKVNNNQLYSFKTISTKDWNTWATTPVIVQLSGGTNSISFIADSAAVALDFIEISAATTMPYQAQSRTCRIRQVVGSGYIGANDDNTLQLMPKDTISRKLLWRIEKINSGMFKLTSVASGKSISVNGSLENIYLHTNTYTGVNTQQWSISDYGNNTVAFMSVANTMNLSQGANDTLVQKTNADLTGQRWVLEDTTVVQYNSIYEPFDYNSGKGLNGLGNAGNGWAGAWNVYEGTATDMTITSGIPFSSLTTTGNKLSANLTTATGLRASRDLYPKWTDDGQNIWVSFLIDINNPTSLANSWQGVSLFNGSTERLLIGKNWGKSVLGLNGLGATEGLSTVSAYSIQPTWVVVLIKTSGNTNTEPVYMWINPDPKKEPIIANANASATVQLNDGFDRIVCHLGNTAGIVIGYDELRIGRSFSLISSPLTALNTIHSNSNFNVIVEPKNESIKVIVLSDIKDKAEISIFDMSGRKILNKQVVVESGENSFNVRINNNIPQGIYLVSLKTNNYIKTTKVVLM
jgi:alpha-D-xyloside xylohydrolase